MMAQAVPNPPPNDKKRVKVYELRNNDWFDRGTGFCAAEFVFNTVSRLEEPRVLVTSEESPDRLLLETRICKEDGFQKQQDTLIVWTEPTTSIDMALSFQESDGCATIWKFISNIQQHLQAVGGPDDAQSDDLERMPMPISLPHPGLGNLKEVDIIMRTAINTLNGREALAKYVLSEDYIRKLIPLVEMAEDMEDLGSLHRLCDIMKNLILLNDNSIIEYAVNDDVVLGVVGALEYDSDFPSHKANHRQWLGKTGRYKEVVRIEDNIIRVKIHQTYRLQYLKDVVLARILDDPTFSVLNSLIFYNQVEIVTHLQNNAPFLKDLFGIFLPSETDQERKKEAVLFIQQCCAVAKSLQPAARQQLYNNFLSHGLLAVINFALRHSDVGVRVGATDVLVSMIDHDPQMIRQTIFRQISEKQTPLTDSLIDLLLVEADLGVKAQIADAIKVLLDPAQHQNGPMDKSGGDFGRNRHIDPQQDEFVKDFYDDSAKRLFKPLVDLKDREDMNFSVHQVSLFIYLIEILCFFVRQHTHRSKYFVLSEKLGQRIAQLLKSPEKYLKLTALKFFRNLIGLQDEFYNQQMMQEGLFEPILSIVFETMPRDNLLNSACLEFFEFIHRENIRTLIDHMVENYREKLLQITYVNVFARLVEMHEKNHATIEGSYLDTEDDTPKRSDIGRGSRWDSGIKDLDATEEEYFNTSDDEDENINNSPSRASMNGASPISKPLVDYNSDDELGDDIGDENMDTDVHIAIVPSKGNDTPESTDSSVGVLTPKSSVSPGPPERLSEKRRREEDEEDELGKLSHHKRRNSSSSTNSSTSSVLRRKRSFNNGVNGSSGTAGKPNKIAISLSPALKTGGDTKGGDGD